MGMYTELHLNAKLHEDTCSQDLAILEYMTREDDNAVEKPDFVPSHRLFSTRGWEYMLVGGAYFPADPHTTFRHDRHYGCYRLCVRCSLKNYDGEIEAFVDWIRPLVEGDGPTDEFLGFSRYEESRHPTLIYLREPMPSAVEVSVMP